MTTSQTSEPTIVLQEEVWTDQPRLVPTTYPAKPVAEFVNWLRSTKAWWEDVDLVHRRVMKLNAELAAIRSAQPTVTTVIEVDREKNEITLDTRKRTRREIALANLEKARAKKAAKHAAPVEG